MALAQSKLTAQGQISVPAEVRRKLGVGPGSVLEWDEEDGVIALFREAPPKPHTLKEMREGLRRYVRERHARR